MGAAAADTSQQDGGLVSVRVLRLRRRREHRSNRTGALPVDPNALLAARHRQKREHRLHLAPHIRILLAERAVRARARRVRHDVERPGGEQPAEEQRNRPRLPDRGVPHLELEEVVVDSRVGERVGRGPLVGGQRVEGDAEDLEVLAAQRDNLEAVGADIWDLRGVEVGEEPEGAQLWKMPHDLLYYFIVDFQVIRDDAKVQEISEGKDVL